MTFDFDHFLRTNTGDVLLFVYGTLRHDVVPTNCHIVVGCGGTLVATGCTVRGRLHNLGWFPGLVLDDHGPPVIGEVWRVPVANMKNLDRYEGPSFRRRHVCVSNDDGEFAAHAYTVDDDRDLSAFPIIPSGNWVQA